MIWHQNVRISCKSMKAKRVGFFLSPISSATLLGVSNGLYDSRRRSAIIADTSRRLYYSDYILYSHCTEVVNYTTGSPASVAGCQALIALHEALNRWVSATVTVYCSAALLVPHTECGTAWVTISAAAAATGGHCTATQWRQLVTARCTGAHLRGATGGDHPS